MKPAHFSDTKRGLRAVTIQHGTILGLLIGIPALLTTPACGSGFHSCQENRTCPVHGGSGGDMSHGGAPDDDSNSSSNSMGGDRDVPQGGTDMGGSANMIEGGAPPVTEGGTTSTAGTDMGGTSTAGTAGTTTEGGGNGGTANGGTENGGTANGGTANGGSGGTIPSTECKTAADCDDHLACNGAETCSAAGKCVAGKAACTNPDAAHCSLACVESGGKAQCNVAALDADKDGHGTTACAAKPGDDCDDGNKTVYTGAQELCDRIDNDCDKKVDLDDGLKMGGTTEEIGDSSSTQRGSPRVVWAPEANMFGFAWRDDAQSKTANIYLEGRNLGGEAVLDPRLINEGRFSSTSLGLAWGGTGFGIAWAAENGNTELWFRELKPSGASGVGPVKVDFTTRGAGDLALARPNSGDWTAAFFTYGDEVIDSVRANAINATGNVRYNFGPSLLPSDRDPGSWNFSAIGSALLFTASSTDESGKDVTTNAYLLDGNLTTTKTIAMTGSYPVGGGSAAGFALATAPSPTFPAAKSTTTLYTPAGLKICGPVQIGNGSMPARAIVSAPGGYQVAFDGFVQEVSSTCVVGPLVSFTSDTKIRDVSIAGGKDGYAVVWQTATNIPKRRIFGGNICN